MRNSRSLKKRKNFTRERTDRGTEAAAYRQLGRYWCLVSLPPGDPGSKSCHQGRKACAIGERRKKMPMSRRG